MLHQSTSASRYATLFFALYDPSDRSLHYSNAGHFPPIHIGAHGTAYLSQGGLPIGLMPSSLYGEGRRELGLGDLLALYTDGVVETPNAQRRGVRQRAARRDPDAPPGRAASELLSRVIDAVDGWSGGGPPHDDITLVLARTR